MKISSDRERAEWWADLIAYGSVALAVLAGFIIFVVLTDYKPNIKKHCPRDESGHYTVQSPKEC